MTFEFVQDLMHLFQTRKKLFENGGVDFAPGPPPPSKVAQVLKKLMSGGGGGASIDRWSKNLVKSKIMGSIFRGTHCIGTRIIQHSVWQEVSTDLKNHPCGVIKSHHYFTSPKLKHYTTRGDLGKAKSQLFTTSTCTCNS